MGFGFSTSWIFGREYSDRTVKDLLALPVSRSKIVYSKFIVNVLWCILLSFISLITGLIMGWIVGLSGWSIETAVSGLEKIFLCVILTILLCPPVAFFASLGRGYLSPLGFIILTIILSQIISALGYGQYFPWAIPAFRSGAAGPGEAQLEWISYIILTATSLAGIISVVSWWRFADQN